MMGIAAADRNYLPIMVNNARSNSETAPATIPASDGELGRKVSLPLT